MSGVLSWETCSFARRQVVVKVLCVHRDSFEDEPTLLLPSLRSVLGADMVWSTSCSATDSSSSFHHGGRQEPEANAKGDGAWPCRD